MNEKFKIVFYQKENGEQPILEFINKLDKKIKAKVFKDIELLENVGYMLREPYSKLLTDGIFELRTRAGKNQVRILYFFYYKKKIVFTNGFVKKSNKTPINEIILAKKYMDDYKRKEQNNGI